MLKITTNGDIVTFSKVDNNLVLLDNADLQNTLFQAFDLDHEFTFSSFFSMLKKYPVFSNFFQTAISYIKEYETLNIEMNSSTSGKVAVITPNTILNNGVISNRHTLEVYKYKELSDNNIDEININESSTTDDVSSMYLKDYANYRIALNSLARLDQIDEEGIITTLYLECYSENEFNLLSFVHFVLSNISLHGFVEERNHVIKEIEVEQKEHQEALEAESIEITNSILERIKYGEKR